VDIFDSFKRILSILANASTAMDAEIYISLVEREQLACQWRVCRNWSKIRLNRSIFVSRFWPGEDNRDGNLEGAG
jgi:hypothetical protein